MDVIDSNQRFFFGLQISKFFSHFDIHFHTVAFKRYTLTATLSVFDKVGNTAYL